MSVREKLNLLIHQKKEYEKFLNLKFAWVLNVFESGMSFFKWNITCHFFFNPFPDGFFS